jgi:hypothetical protein
MIEEKKTKKSYHINFFYLDLNNYRFIGQKEYKTKPTIKYSRSVVKQWCISSSYYRT